MRMRTRVLALLAVLAVTLVNPVTVNADPVEQVVNGGFDTGTAPWWWTGNAPGAVVDGRLCATAPAATTTPWDAIIGQNEIDREAGQPYALSFTASASVPVTIRANVQLADPPYTAELSQQVPLT